MSHTRVTSPYYREATRRLNKQTKARFLQVPCAWHRAEWRQQLTVWQRGALDDLLLAMGDEGGSIPWGDAAMRRRGLRIERLRPLLEVGALVTFDPDDPPEWLRPGSPEAGKSAPKPAQSFPRNRGRFSPEAGHFSPEAGSFSPETGKRISQNSRSFRDLPKSGSGIVIGIDRERDDMASRDLFEGAPIRDPSGGFVFESHDVLSLPMAQNMARLCVDLRAEHGDIPYTAERLAEGLQHQGFAPEIAQAAVEEVERDEQA